MLVDKRWRSHYQDNLGSAEDILLDALHDGNRVFIGCGCGEPQHLVSTLVDLLPRYRDLE